MTEPLAAHPPLKPRRTARDRLARRERIMERVREGRSYEEIAEAEGLSRERIRQIVVEALSGGRSTPSATTRNCRCCGSRRPCASPRARSPRAIGGRSGS